MKGIAHFVAGIAAASCFPRAISAAAGGNPLYMLLGGAFGLLPDTVDFKLIRFLYRHDIEVQPDPLRPDPKMIARAVADAANMAFTTGKPVRIKLNTVRLGLDEWQTYTVRFDGAHRQIEVRLAPVVDTGGGSVHRAISTSSKPAIAPLVCDIKLEYRATISVETFDGPVIEMVPTGEGSVTPVFIPWYRRWTHGILAMLVAATCGVLLRDFLAVWIILAATGTHILLDHAGYMGMSLLFPFKSRRIPGLKLAESTDPLTNFAVVWTALLVIFWNLNSHSAIVEHGLNPIKLGFYGLLLPILALRLFRFIPRKTEE